MFLWEPGNQRYSFFIRRAVFLLLCILTHTAVCMYVWCYYKQQRRDETSFLSIKRELSGLYDGTINCPMPDSSVVSSSSVTSNNSSHHYHHCCCCCYANSSNNSSLCYGMAEDEPPLPLL